MKRLIAAMFLVLVLVSAACAAEKVATANITTIVAEDTQSMLILDKVFETGEWSVLYKMIRAGKAKILNPGTRVSIGAPHKESSLCFWCLLESDPSGKPWLGLIEHFTKEGK